MRKIALFRFFCILLTMIWAVSSCAKEEVQENVSSKADLILLNGQVITVDNNFSFSQAVAVAGNTLVAVGNNEKVMALRGAKTRVIDLKGATVLPGINDAHIHLAWLGLSLKQLDLRYKNIEEIKALLTEHVAKIQPGDFIRGTGWSAGSIGRMPTKEDIDAITPNNPVVFEEVGHAVWVNSKMLEIAGVNSKTEEPSGTKFERKPGGNELTGVLHDADFLIFPHVPDVSDEEKQQAILDAIELLNKQGVTSVTDPGITSEQLKHYQALANDNKLSARVSVHLRAGRSLAEAKSAVKDFQDKAKHDGSTHNRLTLRGIKIFMDGAPPGRTAFMFEDYTCCHGEKGILLYDGDSEDAQIAEINQSIQWLHRQGYQMGIHADGDRSAHVAIEGLIGAMRDYPVDAAAIKENKLRHYLIHGDLVRGEDIQRMAEWNIGLTIQPVITYEAGSVLLELWGPDRGPRHMATSLFIDAGVWTTLSTDSPIVPPDWKQNIEYAALRQGKDSGGKVNGPDYRISVKDALIAHTRTAAYQDFQETKKGTIEVGKLADLAVIDRNILTIDPSEISEIKTLMTIIGGKVVYEK